MLSARTRVMRALIKGGWDAQSAGDWNLPCGHVTAVDFSTERVMLGEVLLDAEVDPSHLSLFESGWYLAREVAGIAEFEVTGPMSEEAARTLVRLVAVEAEALEAERE